MNQKRRFYGLMCVLLLCFSQQVNAQATKTNEDPDASFKRAKELYQKGQFSLAYPIFRLLYYENDQKSSIPVTIKVESEYYSIICGLEVNDAIAEKHALDFINYEHNAPRVQMMSYHLGEYYFRKQDFAKANKCYQEAGVDNLNNSEIAQMKFHQAYGYFLEKDFANAKPLFNSIRQIPKDPNYIDANYYYGFICFYEKNYPEALNAFKIVDNEPAYRNVVPYYVAEIYYFSGDKDKAIEYGETALNKGEQYYDLLLNQLVGHAYFEKKSYAKALPYLEQYVSNTEKVRREDLYELSYCYYEAKKWNKAIDGFKELGGKEDSLAQNSMYLLADAYLKTDQKANARNAFLFCALNSSNPVQEQISKFHYAKLSYELGYNDIALSELKSFVATYPSSTYDAEAKELLVAVLTNTNNYKEALEMAEKVGMQNETVRKVYPKILYGRSVELINDQQLLQANNLLDKILKQSNNTTQLPYTYFWKGEIAYRLNKTDSAIYFLQKYTEKPVNYGEVNTTNAVYDLGYCFLKTENYTKAISYFEQVSQSVNSKSTPVMQDAYVRSADCYFMLKKYSKALQMYESVISQNLPSADYATFQKAIIAGANNKFSEKISILQSITSKYPSSDLVPDVNMEIANTYIANEDFRSAVSPLSKILGDKKAESLYPEAMLKLGVVNFNLSNNSDALGNFKKLVAQYPNSTESESAIEYIRNIYVEQQKPDEFVTFMRENGKNVSYSEVDSLTYEAAKRSYLNNDKGSAAAALNAYIAKYPNGQYFLDAHYLLSEIYMDQKDINNALTHFEAIAAKSPNRYAENSILQAARINYFELKNYTKAETYYSQLKNIATLQENKLESMRGLLRCQYKAQQWKEALDNAKDLLEQTGIATDDKMMANMIIAKNQQMSNELSEALATYKSVIALGKSEYSAEARFRVAEIYLKQDNLTEAEKAGFETINKAGSYNYWITKAYILLGEVYFKQKDYFNSEATLKSVIENATDNTLKQEAQEKLNVVLNEKNKNSKVE